jgi:hypothetical protein
MEIYNVDDPKFGILLYRGAISDDLNLVERLEETLWQTSLLLHGKIDFV